MTARDELDARALAVLCEQWSAAVDAYCLTDARRVGRELLPALLDLNALDPASGVRSGRWVFFARLMGGGYEVARDFSPLNAE